MNPRVMGALGAAAAQSILGASFVVSRNILDYPTLIGQAVRYVLATALFVLIAWFSARRSLPKMPVLQIPTLKELFQLIGISISGLVGFNIVLLAALRHGDAPAVGTIVGATPLVLAIAGPLMIGQRPAVRVLGGAALVVAGVAAVEGGGYIDGIGLVFALLTLLGEVLFSLFAVPLLDRFGPLGVSLWTCALAVPMLGILAVASGEPSRLRPPTGTEVLSFAYLGLFLTVVAFLLWYSGLHRLGAATAGMFIGLVPVVSLAVGVAFDGVQPSPMRIAGAVVVGIG
ncbi:MAG: DMT family transporter, partial [Micromonosporaceae bacterium]|nr:DMT family transporter [Micromonosporaceae bacterium]